jgi:hypothetical protein
MGAIQEIFRQYSPAYLERFGQAMPAEHQKVIQAICQCRTEAYGSVCYQCEHCGHPHVLPAACGNRHCPQCQHRKAHLWLTPTRTPTARASLHPVRSARNGLALPYSPLAAAYHHRCRLLPQRNGPKIPSAHGCTSAERTILTLTHPAALKQSPCC